MNLLDKIFNFAYSFLHGLISVKVKLKIQNGNLPTNSESRVDLESQHLISIFFFMKPERIRLIFPYLSRIPPFTSASAQVVPVESENSSETNRLEKFSEVTTSPRSGRCHREILIQQLCHIHWQLKFFFFFLFQYFFLKCCEKRNFN